MDSFLWFLCGLAPGGVFGFAIAFLLRPSSPKSKPWTEERENERKQFEKAPTSNRYGNVIPPKTMWD